VIGICQDSIDTSFICHPKVSTLLALQVNSTVAFEQIALPEVTSTGLVRLREMLGVDPAYKTIYASGSIIIVPLDLPYVPRRILSDISNSSVVQLQDEGIFIIL
jgi:hypothetical protein